jgi:two-component system chemotaxis response regulator CheY
MPKTQPGATSRPLVTQIEMKSMRILVVEDQKTVGMAISWTLSRLGHEPQFVASGSAAWELIEREDWRLIITDWMMPEMDGLELCRRIRASQGGSYRYVIMLTSRNERHDRLQGLTAGADDFLTKPVDEDELIIRLSIARRILNMQSELEEKNARLNEMARTDPLTGLANRRQLHEVMEGMFPQVTRGEVYSIVALDIDHFKSYNDTFGHAAGDEVLRVVAGVLRAGTRSGDLVVRTGGEEFVILLPGAGSNEALGTAERLRRAIEEHPWPARPVTASFGVTVARDKTKPSSIVDLLAEADRALYHSKQAGRNRVTHSHFIEFEGLRLPASMPSGPSPCKECYASAVS